MLKYWFGQSFRKAQIWNFKANSVDYEGKILQRQESNFNVDLVAYLAHGYVGMLVCWYAGKEEKNSKFKMKKIGDNEG